MQKRVDSKTLASPSLIRELGSIKMTGTRKVGSRPRRLTVDEVAPLPSN